MTPRKITAVSRVLAGAVAVGCLAACSHPDPLRAGPGQSTPVAPDRPVSSPSASPSPQPPPPPPPPLTSVSPSPSFADDTAVSCAGRPTAEQVVARVRTAGLLPGNAQVRVGLGPVCAGSWQYTILNVTGREPLQVVTRGQPSALTLVTAGTEVCSVEVRAQAPPGIVNTAQCGLGAAPG